MHACVVNVQAALVFLFTLGLNFLILTFCLCFVYILYCSKCARVAFVCTYTCVDLCGVCVCVCVCVCVHVCVCVGGG